MKSKFNNCIDMKNPLHVSIVAQSSTNTPRIKTNLKKKNQWGFELIILRSTNSLSTSGSVMNNHQSLPEQYNLHVTLDLCMSGVNHYADINSEHGVVSRLGWPLCLLALTAPLNPDG